MFEQKKRVLTSHVKKNMTSYKIIKVTEHAMARGRERLGINKKEVLQKLSNEARYKGINLNSLRHDTYEKLGLTYEEYKFIKSRFSFRTNSTSIYLYRGCVFIFVGNGGRTLKTVLNLNEYKVG